MQAKNNCLPKLLITEYSAKVYYWIFRAGVCTAAGSGSLNSGGATWHPSYWLLNVQLTCITEYSGLVCVQLLGVVAWKVVEPPDTQVTDYWIFSCSYYWIFRAGVRTAAGSGSLDSGGATWHPSYWFLNIQLYLLLNIQGWCVYSCWEW